MVFTRCKTADALTWETRLYRYDVPTRTTTLLGVRPYRWPHRRRRRRDRPVRECRRQVRQLRPVHLTRHQRARVHLVSYELVRLDITTGQRSVISTSTPQLNPASAFGDPSLSNTGRFLAYHDRDAAGVISCYLYDAEKGLSTLVSHTPTGEPAWVQGFEPQVSGNGRYVAFVSAAVDIVAGMPEVGTVYRRDCLVPTPLRPSSATVRAHIRSGATPAPRCWAISGDGSRVTFTSAAQDLVAGASNRLERVYLCSADCSWQSTRR